MRPRSCSPSRSTDARRRAPSQGCMMKKVINSAPSRRDFLRLTSMAAASALAPTVLWAEQREATDSATSQAESARIATFEEVWRTVRDRFYDPHLHGLDWSAVREHYLPGATRASSEEALAGVINSMLSELHASHTRYYTPEGPEYYQLSDIFAGALRRRGLISRGPYLLSRRWRTLACRHAGPQCDYRRYTRHAGPTSRPARWR